MTSRDSQRATIVTLGLESCVRTPPSAIRDARLGLLMNQASVDSDFRYCHDVIEEAFPGQLAALFSPQHGLWGTEQDNMIETQHSSDDRLRIPVHSLYAETRRPTRDMLDPIDCLIVDLPDVGTRVYTYVWTVTHCLEACAELSIPVVVLDRPNPLGGRRTEGPRLREEYVSFVGRAPIPMVHGLTMGELTLHLNRSLRLDAEVVVVDMEGWRRDLTFPATGRAWVPPSPNLPRFESALLYPGMVLLEGTNLSEGRGTTTPFEVVGAPFVEPLALQRALSRFDLPGVRFRPLRFKPTFQKWSGEECGGLFFHVTDPDRFRPYRTAVALLSCVRALWPEAFQWKSPPFEYEYEKPPIDILSGSSELRECIDRGRAETDLDRLTSLDEPAWWNEVAGCLLYA